MLCLRWFVCVCVCVREHYLRTQSIVTKRTKKTKEKNTAEKHSSEKHNTWNRFSTLSSVENTTTITSKKNVETNAKTKIKASIKSSLIHAVTTPMRPRPFRFARKYSWPWLFTVCMCSTPTYVQTDFVCVSVCEYVILIAISIALYVYASEPMSALSQCVLRYTECTLRTHTHFVFVWNFFYLATSSYFESKRLPQCGIVAAQSETKSTEKRQWIIQTKHNVDGNTCCATFFDMPKNVTECEIKWNEYEKGEGRRGDRTKRGTWKKREKKIKKLCEKCATGVKRTDGNCKCVVQLSAHRFLLHNRSTLHSRLSPSCTLFAN